MGGYSAGVPRKAIRPSAGVWPLARPLKVSSRARVSRLAMVSGPQMGCYVFTGWCRFDHFLVKL